jgi:diaminopimelate decarboxylase
VSEQWKGSEFLPDPVLWPRAAIIEPVAACIGGASCMEYDMLTWRRVPFPRSPQPGDLLVYPNTAGYQMDKNESEFHQLPLPERFVVGRGADEDAAPVWRPER